MATHIAEEIISQPGSWRRAAGLAAASAAVFPAPGERIAVIGCGTSWFMAMSYAVLREQAGQGITDAFAGSEVAWTRSFDRIVVISRSGTTSEVLEVLRRFPDTPSLAVTAVPGSPVTEAATDSVVLDFADEQSVVQTRFATSALALLRASIGEDLEPAARDAELALEQELDDVLDAEQFTFIGRGWAIGLAHEAALKMRETAQHWAESYPSMDYRHGPIAIAEPNRIVWTLDSPPAGLAEDVEATGARFIGGKLDPMAELLRVHRTAVAIAERRGLDPDRPRHLSRSVLLEGDPV